MVKILSKKNKVYSVFREDSHNLEKIKNKNIVPIKCDFNLSSDFKKLEEFLISSNLDILINNAGTFGSIDQQNLKSINFKEFYKVMETNVMAPLKIIQTLTNKSNITLSQIVNISTDMASISNNTSGGYYIYRTTKNAINAVTKNLSIDLKEYNINVYAIHPGNIKTKINPGGSIEPEICAKKLINFIEKNDSNYNGAFVDLSNLKIISW